MTMSSEATSEMDSDQRRAVLDFARHLDQKTLNNIKDIFSRCEEINVDPSAAAKAVAVILGQHVAHAAVALEKSEQEFLKLCTTHYRKARKSFDEHQKEGYCEGQDLFEDEDEEEKVFN